MKHLRFLACLLAFASPARAADNPRLAIVAEAAAQAEVDLLTVELSRQPVVLLERAEIDRVLAQQHLSAAGLTGKPLLQLGALLGADGVLFLNTAKVAGQNVLHARLVAVHPGVIAGAWQASAPGAGLAPWSRETAAAVTALLPKLTVARDAAIPVSVVNLRVTRTRPEAAALESEVALLLIHRLAHEPSFFVLERRQMDALVSEQREEPAVFWTGRYLVDGAIEQGLTDPDQLTIRLRLQPPGGVAMSIVRACRRDELPAAADFLVREIARLLQREPAAAKWDATREAEQFWHDAQWAFGNELFARAAMAAEASAALGRRSAETLTLRIRAELLAALPDLVLPYRYPKNQQYLSGYLTERNWLWRSHISYTRGYRTPNVLAGIYQEMPKAERESRLARTQRALELWRDHAAELLAEPGQIPLATDALTIGGAMLEWFHDNRPWDDGLESLAARLREVDDLATSRVLEFSGRKGQKPPALFWQSKVSLTPLWAADPARTLATYRAALREPFDAKTAASMRNTLVHSRDLVPGLTAGGGHGQLAEPWAKFVEELLASEFPGDRWTGLCLQYEGAERAAQDAIAVRSRDAFWAERARFAQKEFPYAYYELLRLPRHEQTGIITSSTPAPPESEYLSFPRQFLLYLLAESTPIDREFFTELFQPRSYTEPQAVEILAAIRAHEARVRAKIGDHWMLSTIRENSQNLLVRFPNLRTEAPPGDALKITRYWTPYRLAQFRDGTLQEANLYIKEMIYREGRLWVFADFRGPERGRDAKKPMFIFGIDLKAFETEVIPFEEPPPLAVPRKDHWGGANVEISPDAVFVSREWQLSRFDRRTKTWRHFTDMPGVWEQPWLVGGRLYVRINNSPGAFQNSHFGELVEVDPQTGVPTLVASDRRSPAESPLDTWGLSWLTLRAGAEGRVLFRGIPGDGSRKRRYATYDPAAKRWEPLDEAAWKSPEPGAGAAAHLAMAGGENGWKVEGLAAGRETMSLVNGARRLQFHCHLSPEDRALLVHNGPELSMESIEQNRKAPFPSTPLGCETAEGFAFSEVFWMPGFWFVPRADLERAAAEPNRSKP